MPNGPATERARAGLRVLWVSGTAPHPVDGGLSSYSAGLSEALSRTGAHVEGIALRPVGEAGSAQSLATGVRWTLVDDRRRGQASSVLSVLPNIAHSYGGRAFRAALDRSLADGPWDAVVLDHLQSGWALDAVRRWRRSAAPAGRIVHVSHNHEESARREIADATSPLSVDGVALRLDARKIARLERRMVRESDVLGCITEEDAARFRAAGPVPGTVVLEPGYEGARLPERAIGPTTPKRVVILGNFDWHVKRANLDRFLAAADPRFAEAGIELLVIGKAPASYVAGWAPRLRATSFTGFVPDLAATLADARIGVVSEPRGGGFKLKTLDYVFRRVPIAVLEGSVAGLPLVAGDDYLQFRDEPDLVAGIIDVVDDLDLLNRLHEGAYRAASAVFSWDERGRRLGDAIARDDASAGSRR